MFKAFGAVVVLWYVSTLFSQSFRSLDNALSASFETLQAAAVMSREHLDH